MAINIEDCHVEVEATTVPGRNGYFLCTRCPLEINGTCMRSGLPLSAGRAALQTDQPTSQANLLRKISLIEAALKLLCSERRGR